MTTPAICVAEIGGTWVKVGLVRGGVVADYARKFSSAGLRQGAPAQALAEMLRAAMDEAGVAASQVVATVPGFIGVDQDTVLHTANLPELNGVRFATALSQALGVPVTLERDSVLQLLGESAAGAVQGEAEVLAVYFGTGIGAAYLGRDGIFRGGGWALEIGHVPHYRPDLNGTPQRVEAFASGKALEELAMRSGCDVTALFSPDAADTVKAAIDGVIWHQASVVASTVALLSPRIVLLGGGVADMAGFPRELLQARIVETLPIIRDVYPIDIRWAELGWQAAVHGAAALVAAGAHR